MNDVDTGACLEHFPIKVGTGAWPIGAEIKLAWIGFRIRNQFYDVTCRYRHMRNQYLCSECRERDRSKVAQRIVRQLSKQVRVDDDRRGDGVQQRVPVWRCPGDLLHA